MLTGEIKRMKFAKLTFDMTGPGTISIKWEHIMKLRSDKVFQITMKDGALLVTRLDSIFFSQPGASLDNIVEFVRIEGKLMERLEGDVNVGFSYTKSSDITQFNFSSTIIYRIPKIEASIKLNNIISKSSDDTITSKKQDLYLGFLRKLPNRHLIISAIGWERNTQLGLANRYLIAGGYGKILFVDNTQRFLSGIGLSYNQEQFEKGSDYMSNLEAVGEIEYKKFRYSSPKININAQFKVFPSLTDWGRVRMNFNLNTSLEIFKDFLVGLTFYDNFDNRPSKEAASNNDFGITFTIGYEFGK